MKRKSLFLVAFGVLTAAIIITSITSCNPVKKYEQEEQDTIDRYVLTLGDTAYVKTSRGLYYIELEEGTGIVPDFQDTVLIRYVGRLLSNGTVFDSNINADLPFGFVVGMGEVITGLDEGIRYMKEGGKAKLVIPSRLAYGPYGYYNISGYTPLLFEVELVEVRPGPTTK